ncbi:hypothetical protein [Leifsonia sp. NCR5]|uniref:hypothetical protein n=1 Tax=Leifsonia sp. NCR5 TaxID=1978342 RepID=UPI000A198D94|nr:hypothetical protein [Leifsonia sp. NCR5]
MHTRSQRRGLRAAFTVAGALMVAYGLYAGFSMIASATTNTCRQEGPSSPLAVISEGGDVVNQSLSGWPLGRACEWRRADGSGTVTTHSGSADSTAGVYGAILIGAGLLARGVWRGPTGWSHSEGSSSR